MSVGDLERMAAYTRPGKSADMAVPSDSQDLPKLARCLIIGTAGNVKLTLEDGNTTTLTLPVGIFLCGVRRVWSTGLTAANIVWIA